MMYGSWGLKRDKQNFLSYWTIFCPFTPLTTRQIKILKKRKNTGKYYHFTHAYHKWQSYDVWFLRYDAWQTEFFVILDNFLPFHPANNLKNQNFEKMIKAPVDIIILHKCTKNHNHMLYCSWDMACDGCNCFFLFWAFFLPFNPRNSPKNLNFKKNEKNTWRYHHFTHVYQKFWLDVTQFLRSGARETDGWTDKKSD